MEVQALNPDEIIALLWAIVGDPKDLVVKQIPSEREIIFEFCGVSENHRTAAVRTPGSRWFSVEVEQLFDFTYVDEDASREEVQDYVEKCVLVAQEYVRKGALVERRGIFRSRSIVVDAGGAPFRLRRIIGRRA